ncbi:MAG: class I SAM-dependent methyltransferase [Nitrospirae bacterium]|nr:class I SAM-dependent methyltransferase [Nitrospirota bacterium]
MKSISPKILGDGLKSCNEIGKSLVKKKGVDCFLDVGAGEGQLTLEFAETIKTKHIYGIDFVDSNIILLKEKSINAVKVDLNGHFPFDDSSFDIILSSQNIEHICNVRSYLGECYRCLKKGGQFIVLTENLAAWDNIFSLILGWQPFSTTPIDGWNVGNPLTWHLDEEKTLLKSDNIETYKNTGVVGVAGHVRVPTISSLKELLQKTGFIDIEIYTKGYFPFWGTLSEWLCSIDKRHGHFLIASCFK